MSNCPLISLARAPSDQSLSWPGTRTTRHSWKAAGINIFCYWPLERFTFRDFTLRVIYLLFIHDDHFQEFWILTLFFLKLNLSTNLNLSDKQEQSHSLLRCPKITRPSTTWVGQVFSERVGVFIEDSIFVFPLHSKKKMILRKTLTVQQEMICVLTQTGL